MDMRGEFIPRPCRRIILIFRVTVWRAAFLVVTTAFRGPRARIHRPVRHRPQLVACPSMVDRSRPEAHRARVPLHSRLLQTQTVWL